MKFIFFGTPEFASIILEKLIDAGYIPQAVICNPDRPVGRKKIITPPATKLLAQKYNIPVLQPEVLSNSKFKIQNSKFDFFIVAAYAKIIPKEILEIPRLGTIGVHPSLLPKYRGPSPIQAAILNGDEETGVTLYLMDEGLDSGPILANSRLPIATNETYKSLHDKLAEFGADLLIETLPKFVAGEITPLPQNETEATYTKKFKTEDGYIESKDLEIAQNGSASSPQVALEIERKIRALNPEPGVYTFIDGKRTKLLEARLIEGKLRRPSGVGAPTYASVLKITQIQIEGKKATKI